MKINKELLFNLNKDLPSPRLFLRLVRAFPNLLFFSILKKLLLKNFPYLVGCDISPGFYAVVGENLKAINCNLNDTIFINYANIECGENTKFSGENILLTSTHDPKDFTRVFAKPIFIGKNVWVTYRCIILGGVTIGDNTIIGAGSVVVSDIPSNVLAAGNPCRVIREL